MSDILIRAENLGKSYIIGHEKQEPYTALRDVLANKAKQIVGKTQQILHGGQLISGNELEEFWALRNINLEIKQGDRFGIIGRNGAGKSTLLKIISRITEPSTGRLQIKGRVSSLLEVGTGFHPELSGRENIYLNGAILGMKRKEIQLKFDEIVDFSGVEKFLDTPVKRYSSGMYVRLAFAVAAHLETEILVIDEVLAVGDGEFQKKCLVKIDDMNKGQGRTVLFVSHNMVALRSLCQQAVLLNKGRVVAIGASQDIINEYIHDKQETTNSIVMLVPLLDANVSFTKIWLTDRQGNLSSDVLVQDSFIIGLEFRVLQHTKNTEISIVLSNSNGVNVLFSSLSDCSDDRAFAELNPGLYQASVCFQGNFFVPDTYTVRISAHYPNELNIDTRENVFSLNIIETGSTMARFGTAAKYWSCVLGGAKWNLNLKNEINHILK